MTTPKSLGSLRSSRNSFQTRKRKRCTSASLPRQPHRRKPKHLRRVDRERGQLRQKVLKRRAFQHDAAKRDQEIASRDEMSNELKRARHAVDWKNEPRQHDRRQKRDQKRHLKRELLRVGHRGNQQTRRQGPNQE